ncbi:MAG: PBP1A family penicillin-binding protein [Candidatus Marinimicrobia bacterium]|nr:PBP1A family penicillin-binding protein [Candidatus Neomarinimicrobiota bacterium]
MSKEKTKGLLSWGKAFLYAVIVNMAGILTILVILFFYSRYLPDLTELQSYKPDVISKVYSVDGVVLEEFAQQKRIVLPDEKIPQRMREAVMAIEDSRFYSHWGFSTIDFVRAMVVDILRWDFSQGASTFTQQLARILYNQISMKKSISRKIKELLTALKMEQLYTKDEIINMYLNSSYMGGAYGIEAASLKFFNKHAKEMTIAECAHLAGMIQSGHYSPWASDPTKGFRRRNYVLYRMKEMGFINDEQYNLEKNSPIHYPARKEKTEIAPYFVEDVRRIIQIEDNQLGVNLYTDGLSIHTTLDTRLQKIAEEEFQKHIEYQQGILNRRLLANPRELQEIIKDSTITLTEVQEMIRGERPMKKGLQYHLLVQGAFVAMDPYSGEILAMVGGRDFEDSEFNRATQAKRQPGSVFKPIVYGTAVDNGIPVTKKLLNTPLTLDMPDGTRWTPQNYNRDYGGPTTLRDGIKSSLNIIAARVVQELVSPSAVIETAKRLHITTPIPKVDAIALGVGVVIPMEIIAAYGAFCNKGIWIEPHTMKRIVDRYGNIVKEYVPEKEMVLSEETAFMVTSLLQTVKRDGTGKSSEWKYGFRHNAAGKTGTTTNWVDAWFVGYSPYIIAGVYVGVDDPNVPLGEGQSGATAALPVWANFMRRTHELMQWPDKAFEIPDGIIQVEICKESKKLPSRFCTDLEKEYFIRGTEPVETCNTHAGNNQGNDNLDELIF